MGSAEAATNVAKHGISFEDAQAVFGDDQALDGPIRGTQRPKAAPNRTRRVSIVAYTIRRRGDEEVVRIISARAASRKERRAYHATP
jgi:uncharacterized DUF497 family protein